MTAVSNNNNNTNEHKKIIRMNPTTPMERTAVTVEFVEFVGPEVGKNNTT